MLTVGHGTVRPPTSASPARCRYLDKSVIYTEEESIMSTEAAQALIDRMKIDQAFRDRVLAAPEPETRLALIQAEGYECSADDLASFDAAVADSDLERVAAGKSPGCMTLPCPFFLQ
jgi:predicted ribosomally synthesized peptide with nif11-like leader